MSSPQQNPNLAQLAAAAEKLEPLLDQIAFVGGSVTGLLLTDPAAPTVRPTLDVDAIVAISSTSWKHYPATSCPTPPASSAGVLFWNE